MIAHSLSDCLTASSTLPALEMSPGSVSAITMEASISASSIDRSNFSARPSSSRCVWQSITMRLLDAWRAPVQRLVLLVDYPHVLAICGRLHHNRFWHYPKTLRSSRSSLPNDYAWNGQPRGVCGAFSVTNRRYVT